ncbi:PREDICTED: formin-like protein 16 [Chinchilla lanigera]|uniref:formin-like protein 16 n=1 Tax=Chinchilla lanigera TaxID=34839 RepID=UPI00038EDF67|nr:PREDICTED: formin-like protein 16 [Chinchilla lanigera]
MAARPSSASRRGHQPSDPSWERFRRSGGGTKGKRKKPACLARESRLLGWRGDDRRALLPKLRATPATEAEGRFPTASLVPARDLRELGRRLRLRPTGRQHCAANSQKTRALGSEREPEIKTSVQAITLCVPSAAVGSRVPTRIPGGSPSPPHPPITSPPGGVGEPRAPRAIAPLSLRPRRVRPPAPDGCTLAPTLAHAGAHAQVVTHQGQRRRQPEHARVALQPPPTTLQFICSPTPKPTPPGRPPKKSPSPPTRTHTYTHTYTK